MSSDPWGDRAPKPLPAPPALPEAEFQLLGILLNRPKTYDAVCEIVQPRHFSEDSAERVWTLIAAMHERGVAADMALLLEPAAAALGWERKETAKFLAKLVQQSVSTSAGQAIEYARSIRSVWMRRELFGVSVEIQERVRRGDVEMSGGALLEDVEGRLYALTDNAESEEERAVTLTEAVNAGLRQANEAALARESGELIGVPSGLGPIDRKLGGFRGGDLITVAARPSMGKTAWALKVARSAAEDFMRKAGAARPDWVLFFSLEMGADQLGTRWASAAGRVSFERIRRGEIDADEMMRLNEGAKELDGLPVWIDDTPAITVPAMRMRARRLKRRRGGLGLIVVDYLQLIGLTREQRRETDGNRVQEVSLITRQLKQLAKSLNVPVIALSQLSREVEKREDKRPQLADLRESGSIEQDSDLVGFLYREAYYLERRPPTRKERETEIDYQARRAEWSTAVDKVRDQAEFILEKNRHGSLGSMVLKFHGSIMLFSDDTPGDASPSASDARKQQLRMDLQTVD